jgi:hypothetical protein
VRRRRRQVYQEEKEVSAMMDLRMAYENNDIAKFERTLQVRLTYSNSSIVMTSYITL